MCLGEVLGRITNPGGSKRSQPQTPDPVGKESAVSSTPVTDSKPEEKKTKLKTGNSNTQSPSSSPSTSMTDTRINY